MIPAPADAELAAYAPAILLGRGGTRLLSDVALPNSVFMGNRLDARQGSAEWLEVLYLLALEVVVMGVAAGSERDDFWCARTRQQAAAVFGTARLADSLREWKLPGTMLALLQVLRAFFRARAVHLVRHPVSSALRRTHTTSQMDNPIGRAVLPAA